MKILVKGGEALFGIGRIESKKQLETTINDIADRGKFEWVDSRDFHDRGETRLSIVTA